jgi:hypothetical protein
MSQPKRISPITYIKKDNPNIPVTLNKEAVKEETTKPRRGRPPKEKPEG